VQNDLLTIQALLTTTPDRWNSLAQTLPSELMERKPAQGEWSAAECLHHIIDVERLFQFRLTCFQSGQDFPAFYPDSELSPAGTPVELAAEFEQLRQQSLQSIQSLGGSDLDRQVTHAELGPVTLREMLHEWAGHDLNHTIQAERALMQPFILACGPWKRYFEEHLAK
jgi:uncharacterized damage-inducible protein DinB